MSRSPHVAVIVLNWNGRDDTLACLESLRQSDYSNVQVIVVDNGSTDDSVSVIRQRFPGVTLIENGKNLGYAAGNNVGLTYALEIEAEYAFLLNNDTVIAPDCISTLVRTDCTDPAIGAVGPIVYTWDDGRVISSAGGAIDWRHADAANIGAGEIDRGQYAARPVDFVNGCGLMLTRQAVERVGLLDERYFMYWEETDWCTRVRRAGLDLRFEPAARMRHKATIRSDDLGPMPLYYMTRNRLLFFATHAPPRIRPITLAHAVHGAWRGIIGNRRAGRFQHAQAMQTGIVDGLRRRWGRIDAPAWQSDRSAPLQVDNVYAAQDNP